MSALVPAVLGVAAMLKLRRRRRIYDSYRMTRDGDALTNRSDGMTPHGVKREDVTVIFDHPQLGLLVQTAQDSDRLFHVSSDLEGYGELRELLGTWRPFTPLTPSWLESLSVLTRG